MTRPEWNIAGQKSAAIHKRTYIRLAASGLMLMGAGCAAFLPPLAPPALICSGAAWAIYALVTIRLFSSTPANWSIGFLVLMLPVTLWATWLPEITQPATGQLAAGIFVYFGIVNFCAVWNEFGLPKLGVRLMMWGVTGTGIALCLLALLGVQWIIKAPIFKPLLARLPSGLIETINPNVMGGILAIVASTLMGYGVIGWRGHRWIARIVLLLTSLGTGVILVLTQSRGAWLALVIALLTVLLLSGRSSIKIAAILILVVASLVVWSLGVEQINGLLFKSQAVDTLEKRTEIWSRALYMIQDFPFTGIGMGTFQPIATMLYPFFLADPNAQIPHAHNLFLQVAVDLGIPGLIAWLAILMLVIIAAWQVYRHGTATGNQWLAGLGAGLLCSQVALIVHGLTDAVTWGTRPAIIVWAIWGLAMAARNQIPPNDL